MPNRSTRKTPTIFRQICELIPAHLVPVIARKHEIASRSISPWSHVVSMLYAQFTHALGLNDVCDALRANRSMIASIRSATPPSRNGLSHANKTRDCQMAQDIFWQVLDHLQSLGSGFGGRPFTKLPRRFKRAVYAVDSTTIKLFANCMDWARHRRRKAAAKLHLCLNLQCLLPAFAVVDSAKGHDNTKARQICACIQSGEIVVFDMAYIDYEHLYELTDRGVFWVSRVKSSMKLRCTKRHIQKQDGAILRDDCVLIESKTKRKEYPQAMRKITAQFEIDGKTVVLEFLTNNFEWAATSICDLYKSRWNIELFFKQIKQTLNLGAFLGHSRNAIEWQVWMALLAYILLRFLHAGSNWAHSFIRLLTCLRAVLWQRRNLSDYLQLYGTAGGSFRILWAPHQAYLPGFGEDY